MQIIDITNVPFSPSNPWGFIPTFLSLADTRSAKEQFNARYISGWHSFEGFTLDKDTLTLTYPEDPPLKPIQIATFRDEKIAIYPHAWVLVMSANGEWEVCRMD
jgi:hypothetical protein